MVLPSVLYGLILYNNILITSNSICQRSTQNSIRNYVHQPSRPRRFPRQRLCPSGQGSGKGTIPFCYPAFRPLFSIPTNSPLPDRFPPTPNTRSPTPFTTRVQTRKPAKSLTQLGLPSFPRRCRRGCLRRSRRLCRTSSMILRGRSSAMEVLGSKGAALNV